MPPTAAFRGRIASVAALPRWRAALAARHVVPADVVAIGDSITEGTGASARETRWLDLLAAQLRAAYPTALAPGGAGYIPAYTMSDYPSNWGYGGNVAGNGTFGLGRRTVVLKSPDGWASRLLYGTSVVIAWTAGPGLGTFRVLVDGVVVGSNVSTVNAAGATGGYRLSVPLGTRGAHTVRVEWVSGGDVYLSGMFVRDGDETRGVRVNDSGQHGSSSADWSRLTSPGTAYLLGQELAAVNPALVLLGLGPNDMIQGLTPASHLANMRDIVAQIRSTAPGADIVVHAAYQLAADYTYPWSAYLANLATVAAETPSTVLLDFSKQLPRANANPFGMIAADGVHLNDTGDAFYAARFRGVLTDPHAPRYDVATQTDLAASIAQLNASLGVARTGAPTRYTDWRSRPTGQTPVTGMLGDDGVPLVISKSAANTESATTANGRLEVSWPASSNAAFYLQSPLPSRVKRIGCSFGFGPASVNTAGSFCLATWDTDGAVPGVSQASCHLFVTATTWAYQVVSAGSFYTISQGAFATPLPMDYSELRMEVIIEGTTAYILLPDGTAATATDPRIASINGYSPCWEFFRNTGATTVPEVFYETWASTTVQPLGRASLGGLAKSLAPYVTLATVQSALGYYATLTDPRFTDARPPVGHVATHASGGSDPLAPIDIGAVALTQRGPIGGSSAATLTGQTYTIAADGAPYRRWTCSGNPSLAVPSAGPQVEGQTLTFILASNSSTISRTFTLASGYELSMGVTSRVIAVPPTSSPPVRVEVECRDATNNIWRINSVDAVSGGGAHASTHATGGSDPVTPASIGAADSTHNHNYLWVFTNAGGTIAPDARNTKQAWSVTGNIIINTIAMPYDGQLLNIEVYASGGARTVGITGTNVNGTQRALPATISSGGMGIFGFYYSARAGHWVLVSIVTE